MNHNRRRRKQRPNFGRRMIEVCRSAYGFGFTISGQQPCILSCIVPNSPADDSGLRAGDFLISVNGINVSKLPHELVVQLINKTEGGSIRLTIAENYFSDSSDEDNNFWTKNSSSPVAGNGPSRTRRPKYPHQKVRTHKMQSNNKNMAKLSQSSDNIDGKESVSFEYTEAGSTPTKATAHNIIHSPNASNNRDVNNVSAMVPPARLDRDENHTQLEYRTVVGYLGTIEMPKQIATSSKLQTVRSCIRKMRQEKRQHTIVLMQILPNCLKLYNSENALIAKYTSNRLVYVSSNHMGTTATGSSYAETDTRFFGLVTSSAYQGESNREWLTTTANIDNVISNSCHVFVIDTKLIEHSAHFQRAEHFSIVCTTDPISNCCLEFPNSSEYVVNLIRSMYSLNCSTSSTAPTIEGSNGMHKRFDVPVFRQQQLRHQNNHGSNSPQPSNHSEVTTASSNSDSGIGFHNDFANVSDRIVVVDFPGAFNQQMLPQRANFHLSPRVSARPIPYGADSIRNIRSTDYTHHQPGGCISGGTPVHAKSKSLDMSASSSQIDSEFATNKPDLRMIRAMPDPCNVHFKETMENKLVSPVKYETVYGGNAKHYQTDYVNDAFRINNNFHQSIVESQPRHSTDHPLRVQPRRSERLLATQSCDNLLMNDATTKINRCRRQLQSSFDDVSLLGEAPPPPIGNNSNFNDDHVFATPQLPTAKSNTKKGKLSGAKSSKTEKNDKNGQLLMNKLSPQVFGVLNPSSVSENGPSVKTKSKEKRKSLTTLANFSVWGSLQSLPTVSTMALGLQSPKKGRRNTIEPAFSEPDLSVSIQLLLFNILNAKLNLTLSTAIVACYSIQSTIFRSNIHYTNSKVNEAIIKSRNTELIFKKKISLQRVSFPFQLPHL